MGQYHIPVNLDKREFVHPHKLGCGLKLWEQLAAHPGTGAALVVLLASASNGQGGGDLRVGPRIVGRWRGDRVAFVGDYDDSKHEVVLSSGRKEMTGAQIYKACGDDGLHGWRDVSAEVCAVIERELDGKFEGSGWRNFVFADGRAGARGMKPDMVITLEKPR
jgi:hypothetical protein